jgi:CheY-like chemotaxis protein
MTRELIGVPSVWGGKLVTSILSTRSISKMGMKGREGHVLVVDDEPQIRRVMRTTLESRGYEVAEAGSGEQALDLIRSVKLDLILLDINLPGKTGIETCREIRAISTAPVIMLTVRDAGEDKIEALDAGACDYVTKPFVMGGTARARSGGAAQDGVFGQFERHSPETG